MSHIHVLAESNGNVYTVVVHIATPAGNNSAGVLWSDAVKNSGRNVSVLAIGTGPGQITTAEMASVTNGLTLEAVVQWQDDPTWNDTQRVANLNLVATQLTDELLARYGRELKYFGFTQ